MSKKSKEELNVIKEEVEAVNEKLQELTPEELEQVNCGLEIRSGYWHLFRVNPDVGR